MDTLTLLHQKDVSEQLFLLKRKFYLFAIGVGFGVSIIDWGYKAWYGLLTSADDYIFPGISVILLTTFVLTWLRKYEGAVEIALFCGLALTLLFKFFEILILHGDPVSLFNLANLIYWMPAVYIFAYIMFDTRGSLIASLAYMAGIFAIGAFHLTLNTHNSQAELDILTGFFLGQAVYVALLTAFLTIKDQFAKILSHVDFLKQLASTDLLTGAANRRSLTYTLSKEIQQSAIKPRDLCMLIFDLDDFKLINATHGHQIGDQVLVEAILLVRKHLRESDVLARYGGDEFIIMAADTNIDQACLLADRLREVVSAHEFEHGDKVTASFGVASAKAGQSIDQILHKVDRLMCQAKKSGRNQVVCEADLSMAS